MKNKYLHRAKISEKKFRQMLNLFCLDLTAIQIAEIAGLNRNTVNRYMMEIRSRIFEYCQRQAEASFTAAKEEDHRVCRKLCDISSQDVRLVGLSKTNGKIRCWMVSGQAAKQFEHMNSTGKKR